MMIAGLLGAKERRSFAEYLVVVDILMIGLVIDANLSAISSVIFMMGLSGLLVIGAVVAVLLQLNEGGSICFGQQLGIKSKRDFHDVSVNKPLLRRLHLPLQSERKTRGRSPRS